jgi:hypothetical protein
LQANACRARRSSASPDTATVTQLASSQLSINNRPTGDAHEACLGIFSPRSRCTGCRRLSRFAAQTTVGAIGRCGSHSILLRKIEWR